MSSVNDVIKAATKLWNISGAIPGGAAGKAPAVRVQFTDTTGAVVATVFSTNQDGVVASGQMTNQLSSAAVTYTPTTPGGVPFDGPAAAARNVAIDTALFALMNTIVPQILAAGGTWP